LLDKHEQVRDDFYSTIGGQRAREISEKLSAIHEAVISKPGEQGPGPTAPAAIPRADSRRFSVAIAHLTHDDDHEMERLIVESVRDLAGVQILRFDRTISAEGSIPEDSAREAHETAQRLLNESSADVLIWGTVLYHDGRTAPRLYWTTANNSSRARQPYIPQNFQLPELFWDDLAEILRLLVITRSSELFARRGKLIVAELAPFVDKVRTSLESGAGSRRWSQNATTRVTFILAMALQHLGIQTSNRDNLIQAIRYYRAVVSKWTAAEYPGDWEIAQNGLGIAVGALGRLESDSVNLLGALAIFRDLLARLSATSESGSRLAPIQNNLGNTLLTLGERETGSQKLGEAAESYRAALTQWTRDRFPLDWATVQDHLGYALQLAGSRRSGTDLLVSAVAAHRNALEELNREEVPMYWAQAQNNLGSALKILGERQSCIELLEEAASAYRLALEERVFKEQPLAWAEAKNNLGGVLLEIADRSGNLVGIEEAVTILRESLEVRTQAAAPMAFASSKNNLGPALVRLGEFKNEPRYFKEAIDALNVWTRESTPTRWAIAQQNLGDAYMSMARNEKSVAVAEEAHGAYELALSERHRDREPLHWAGTQAALGARIIF
jgi:tetratricopeptide (TPR) repeat protein